MANIASGAFTGSPSEYLVFTNIIIGKVLKKLYTHDNNYDWYSIYLFSAHFLSMWFLLIILLRINLPSKLYPILFFLFIFVFFELRFLVSVQFTTTSAVAGVTGLMLLITESKNEKNSIVLNIAGIILIFFSFLCRKQAFFLVLIPLMPFLLCELYHKRSRLLIGSLVIAGACCFSAEIYNRHEYQSDPGWKEFTDFNSYRSRIHGYPVLNEFYKNEKRLSEIGWTKNDLYLFKTWFYTDKDKFSKEKLKQVLEIHNGIEIEIVNWTETLKGHVAKIQIYILFSTFFTFSFMFFRITSSRENLLIGITFLVSAALILYLCYEGRIVERISLPILYVYLIVGSYLILTCFKGLDQRIKDIFYSFRYYLKITGLLLKKEEDVVCFKDASITQPVNQTILLPARAVPIIVLLMFCAGYIYKQVKTVDKISNKNVGRQLVFENLIQGYTTIFRDDKTDPTLISWGGYIPLDWQKPLKVYPSMNSIKIINLGWPQHSPLYDESLKRSHINDIDMEILTRSDLFLCMDKSYIKLFRKYIQENYNKEIEFQLIGEEYYKKFQANEISSSKIYRFRIKDDDQK